MLYICRIPGEYITLKHQELEESVQKMIKDERITVNHLGETIKKTKNNVIKILMQIMLIDSLKHAKVLEIILSILKTPKIESSEISEVSEHLKTHVEEEKFMMENFENMVDKVEDQKIRFLLENIITDEKRHHNIVERIAELVADSETSDDEWWDFLYRYSRLK
jgi:rubrerythrin